ncbi:Hypothetical predicted protein [Cloeon dipterum]|uniref:C2H2-type domain-containing protein n=1 Tax=Cloeon dipterum TaxID=197152 RepID=A0A8S1CZK2_9INSE|nr:Hypothetical predicted protein [Cloeon dipterum]
MKAKRSRFRKHMQGHEKNDCKLCDELFTSQKKLKVHMREKHNQRLLDYSHKCKFCDKTFTRRQSLYKHLQLHAKEKQVCNFCGEFCNSKEDLESHVEQAHEESQMMCCALCHQTFSRKQQYNAHLQSHEKYQCLTCKQGFSAWKVLLEHQQNGHQVCTEKPKHKCDTCNKKFIRVSALEQHRRKHLAEKKQKCKPCNASFTTGSAYENHLQSKNHKLVLASESDPAQLEFQCDNCKKYFVSKKAASSHFDRTHHNRDYECNICQYRTRFKTNLARHVKLHFNDRSFVCELCGSAFYNLSALKDHHTFLHSENRDHVCSQCSKSFKRPSELTRHMKSHSDNRPYTCNSCENKSFKRSSHLKRHREKCHNDQTAGRIVDRYIKDESGQLVLKPVERKKAKKKPKQKAPQEQEEAEHAKIEDDLTLAPMLADANNHYYMSVSTDSGQDLVYISHQQLSLQENDQPIDLEMPKNYTCTGGDASLDLAKPRHHFQVSEISSLLDSDVRLHESVVEEFVQRQQSRESPVYLADLSRYADPQMLLLPDFGRHQINDMLLTRDDQNLSMPADLTAEDLRHLQQNHFAL